MHLLFNLSIYSIEANLTFRYAKLENDAIKDRKMAS